MNALLLHTGGWEATKTDLAAVPVPAPDGAYVPVPYTRFVEELEIHVPRFGLTIQDARFALAKGGNHMFGVLTCTNGMPNSEYGLAIGLRNSYDRSLAVGLVAGSRVFCCDNLAFSGEVTMARKHTANVFRDLPDLIYRMLSEVSTMRERMDAEIVRFKQISIEFPDMAEILVRACVREALPFSYLPRVITEWDRRARPEFKEPNAWSLLNVCTEVMKSRSARAQVEGSLRLTEVFREVLQV